MPRNSLTTSRLENVRLPNFQNLAAQSLHRKNRSDHGGHKRASNHSAAPFAPPAARRWQSLAISGVTLKITGSCGCTSRAPPGYPGKNPGISRRKSLVSLGFEGHTELFGPYPFTWKTSTPPEDIRTQKFGFVLFSFA